MPSFKRDCALSLVAEVTCGRTHADSRHLLMFPRETSALAVQFRFPRLQLHTQAYDADAHAGEIAGVQHRLLARLTCTMDRWVRALVRIVIPDSAFHWLWHSTASAVGCL